MIFSTDRRWVTYVAALGVLLLVLTGIAQAAHFHGPERLGNNHCSTCLASHAPAAPVSQDVLVVHSALGMVLVASSTAPVFSRTIISSFIRPPPAA
jgi:hypothetical protein